MQEVNAALERSGVPFTPNTSLHTYTTWKIGGLCDLVVFPRSVEEVSACICIFNTTGIPWMIIGKGSNMLVSDEGFHGAVLRLSGAFDTVSFRDDGVTAGAGYSLITLSLQAAKYGFTGLEFAGGIPGTVGGAVCMNAGAHSSDISQTLSRALVMNETGELITLEAKDLNFGYRNSVIQHNPWVVLEATFSLLHGDRTVIVERTRMFKEKRMRTQPLKQPSCGSVFRNPLPLFAAEVIESCGLKGHSIGGAKFSEIHSNFIVNTGGATAKDVLALIELAEVRARQEHDVTLVREVLFVGFN
ncbi:UDP-N-acetylmuramate dehydrogenase [Paenibacillus sp. LMG 31456]|uniref:UDP-N-acetylenolpyruvoylglucosamine reductase n=1 Tax=Paenibacillus foliorum TaxID=2654974 RepID=A0A972GYQ5_9BACL|nr:UDP-N-acetylmuramate dehydrogenase [Paenibacillus foliorum]NOU96633.1 UDP-N-acetylmuramate dehydrogenase [Paenibacillus foliorum]